MKLIDLFRSNPDTRSVANREALARYQKLRATSMKLNNRLVNRISKETLYEGARKLGILHGNTIVFDTKDESAVLMDYCIYNVREKGYNGIEQYLIDCPPDPKSDEMNCLQAMQRANYSLFVVESVARGFGVTVRDLLSQEVRLVVDIGFGNSAIPGLVLASRLLPHDGFSITGGAAVPAGVLTAAQRAALIKSLSAAITPDDNGGFDPAPLISACLRGGGASRVRYEDVPERSIGPQRIPNDTPYVSVGRNQPCPCGSGRKSKHCCMKNR
ncbi:MAG: SEC-C metal-binding domain-containing protein [Planctomycetia bacterium]